eukprot:13361603-Ditylum_brightwellii.AAC.1
MLVLLKNQIKEEKKLYSCLKKLFYRRLDKVDRKKRTRVHNDGKGGQGDKKGCRKTREEKGPHIQGLFGSSHCIDQNQRLTL